MKSFFKRKNALESWDRELSNAFFRLKNDLLEQKLWTVLVNRFFGVTILLQNSSKSGSSKIRLPYYFYVLLSDTNAKWVEDTVRDKRWTRSGSLFQLRPTKVYEAYGVWETYGFSTNREHDPKYRWWRVVHNFCALRSFFKRKKALKSSHRQLFNAFFRLKNDLNAQKLWANRVECFKNIV